ncbi:helix-turn-helix domain-containing protein [Streptomyces avermitilis]
MGVSRCHAVSRWGRSDREAVGAAGASAVRGCRVIREGVRPPQVARRLRVSHKSACAWHARWRDSGVEGLRSKGPSGCPSRMKPEWRAWLCGLTRRRRSAVGPRLISVLHGADSSHCRDVTHATCSSCQ